MKPPKYVRAFLCEWKWNQPRFREIGFGIKPLGPFFDLTLFFWNWRCGWVWYDIANKSGFFLGKKHNKLTTPTYKL